MTLQTKMMAKFASLILNILKILDQRTILHTKIIFKHNKVLFALKTAYFTSSFTLLTILLRALLTNFIPFIRKIFIRTIRYA